MYSSDGKTIVSTGEDRTIRVWDAETVTERLELERQSDWAPTLAVSPDNKTIAVGRLDGSLGFYDTTSGKLIPSPPPSKPELAALLTAVSKAERPAREAVRQELGRGYADQD